MQHFVDGGLIEIKHFCERGIFHICAISV